MLGNTGIQTELIKLSMQKFNFKLNQVKKLMSYRRLVMNNSCKDVHLLWRLLG